MTIYRPDEPYKNLADAVAGTRLPFSRTAKRDVLEPGEGRRRIQIK